MTQDPFGPDSYPEVVKASEERRELFRIAAVRCLKSKPRDPHVLAWAQAWASIKPLNRPLGTGEPNSDERCST